MNRRLHEALLGAIAAIGVLVLLGYASGVLAGRDLSDQSVSAFIRAAAVKAARRTLEREQKNAA